MHKDLDYIVVLMILSGCNSPNTPDLPDLNKPSFSYDEVIQKQKDLEAQASCENL